jgi:hypothetical protein
MEQNPSLNPMIFQLVEILLQLLRAPVWSTVSRGTNWLEILMTKQIIYLLRFAFFWGKISLMCLIQ